MSNDSDITRRVHVPKLRREQLDALDDELVHLLERPSRVREELQRARHPRRDDEETRRIRRY